MEQAKLLLKEWRRIALTVGRRFREFAERIQVEARETEELANIEWDSESLQSQDLIHCGIVLFNKDLVPHQREILIYAKFQPSDIGVSVNGGMEIADTRSRLYTPTPWSVSATVEDTLQALDVMMTDFAQNIDILIRELRLPKGEGKV